LTARGAGFSLASACAGLQSRWWNRLCFTRAARQDAITELRNAQRFLTPRLRNTKVFLYRADKAFVVTPYFGRRKGAEVLEFTLVLLPMLALTLVLLDTAWAIYAKSTLQYAVRIGVRTGATITAAQTPSGVCLTDVVKDTVQQNAFGLLQGTSSRGLIKVNYFEPPAANSTGPVVDVSSQIDGNTPGNIMQVSVQNYSLIPLLPRIFNWNEAVDNNPLAINVFSADRIEPSRNPPCIGTAP
jgi:hypothetical protein